MEEKTTKRREWIKSATIVFLVILLLLTLFSNTIMNYSLPEVATIYVQPGTIATRVRGTATVEASDPYNVVAGETRTITSVAVKVGEEVEKDDVIYYLEEAESTELKEAEAALAAMELAFMQALFTGDISSDVIGRVVEGDFKSFDEFKNRMVNITSGMRSAENTVEDKTKDVESAQRRLAALGADAGDQVERKDKLLLDVEAASATVFITVNGILDHYGEAAFATEAEAITEARTKAVLKSILEAQAEKEEGEEIIMNQNQYDTSALAYDQVLGSYNRRVAALEAAIDVAADELIIAQNDLREANERLEEISERQTNIVGDTQAELSFNDQMTKIEAQQAEIERLKEKSIGSAISAPVAGIITALSNVAGETVKMDEVVAVIQVDGKGYTASFSVTNEQASKVQVGDPAEVSGGWWWNDLVVNLVAIRPDPENPGQQKQLMFSVSGSDVQAGQQLNISVGQRSANYDLTVPNSAVREDSNGKFILIVDTRETPIGNRYYATRVDVEVIAEDETNTAINAGINPYVYAITTATKPVTPGQQVRLVN